MIEDEKIVVPWDFSRHSKAALQFARSRFSDETIKVICVLEPPNPYAPEFNWESEAKEKAESNCRSEFQNEIGPTPECALTFQVAFGEPAIEICRFAQQVKPNYIVMSTHGRTGLKKLFMGSIAQKVLAESRVPVVLLPALWFEQQVKPESNAIVERAEA